MLTVTQVGAAPGGEAFLLDAGKKTMLVDAGFAFCGEETADRLERALAGRPLDVLFLTHTHYDHCGGSVAVSRRRPEARIVAGEYAKRVFARPGALAVIREMDLAAARQRGLAGAAEEPEASYRPFILENLAFCPFTEVTGTVVTISLSSAMRPSLSRLGKMLEAPPPQAS